MSVQKENWPFLNMLLDVDNVLFCFFHCMWGFISRNSEGNLLDLEVLDTRNTEIPLGASTVNCGVWCANMGDHFDLLVDRLLTESTLEAALESRKRSMQAASSAVNNAEVDLSLLKMGLDDIKYPGKLVECRICHDDDEDSNMETPCSCCGSLKVSSLLAWS